MGAIVGRPVRRTRLRIGMDTRGLARNEACSVTTIHVQTLSRGKGILNFFGRPIRFRIGNILRLVNPGAVYLRKNVNNACMGAAKRTKRKVLVVRGTRAKGVYRRFRITQRRWKKGAVGLSTGRGATFNLKTIKGSVMCVLSTDCVLCCCRSILKMDTVTVKVVLVTTQIFSTFGSPVVKIVITGAEAH